MPSSFESFTDETRPLALLDEPPRAQTGAGAALASVLLIVLPLLVVVLL